MIDTDEDEFEPGINLFLYGALVKKARLDLGYRKAEDFVDAMERMTGYKTSKDILYRIESGKREPSANFMVALNIMRGKPLLDNSILEMSLPREWMKLGTSTSRKPYDFDKYKRDKSADIPF